MKTYAPSSTKSLAVARAIPEVAPVITATLSLSFATVPGPFAEHYSTRTFCTDGYNEMYGDYQGGGDIFFGSACHAFRNAWRIDILMHDALNGSQLFVVLASAVCISG